MKLSKNEINTFCGEAVTLRAIDAKGEVSWRVSDENGIFLRSFKDALPDSFSDRVVIVPLKEGEFEVSAESEGEVCICRVSSREMRTYKKGEKLGYYFADFHNHTSWDHKADSFPFREKDLPQDLIKIADDGKIDAIVISDHADISNNADFFRTMEEAEKYSGEMVFFGGMESEVNLIEEDKNGKATKAGEVVTFNCDNYSFVPTWDEFFERMGNSPLTICKFAHPQVLGYGKAGIWNFKLREKRDDARFKKLFRLTEMGNGSGRSSNIVHEYAYSEALDWGFKISPDSSSDCHGPDWGFNACPGKTIIMAPEKSKEMFLDAILNNRVYATESGNVKLYVNVNGYEMGETAAEATEYNFNIEFSAFDKEKEAEIIKLEIISDYGKSVYKKCGKIENKVNVTINSSTARYFYIRLCDSEGFRTWSAPIWTGREFDEYVKCDFVKCNELFESAADIKTGKDAGVLINGSFCDNWEGDGTSAEIEVTLKSEEKIDAIGLYQHYFTSKMRNDIDPDGKIDMEAKWYAAFPKDYEVYGAGEDGEYKLLKENSIRIFGEEHIICLGGEPLKKFKIKFLNTCGSVYEKKRYADENIKLAEINIYKK